MLRILARAAGALVESALRNLGGPVGQRLRYAWYRGRLAACGRNVRIGEGVIIQNPGNISIGDDVNIMPYTLITAMPKGHALVDRIIKDIPNPRYPGAPGAIRIGSQVWIGAYNILQGYGGLEIGDKVTTSARVSVYSFSHHPRDEADPGKVTYASSLVAGSPIACVRSPVVLEEGAWLGLNVVVLGGTVGRNSFVATNSVVLKDLPENSYAKGSPAARIRARFEA